jgi:flagellar biosynthesis component FlhA
MIDDPVTHGQAEFVSLVFALGLLLKEKHLIDALSAIGEVISDLISEVEDQETQATLIEAVRDILVESVAEKTSQKKERRS